MRHKFFGFSNFRPSFNNVARIRRTHAKEPWAIRPCAVNGTYIRAFIVGSISIWTLADPNVFAFRIIRLSVRPPQMHINEIGAKLLTKFTNKIVIKIYLLDWTRFGYAIYAMKLSHCRRHCNRALASSISAFIPFDVYHFRFRFWMKAFGTVRLCRELFTNYANIEHHILFR